MWGLRRKQYIQPDLTCNKMQVEISLDSFSSLSTALDKRHKELQKHIRQHQTSEHQTRTNHSIHWREVKGHRPAVWTTGKRSVKTFTSDTRDGVTIFPKYDHLLFHTWSCDNNKTVSLTTEQLPPLRKATRWSWKLQRQTHSPWCCGHLYLINWTFLLQTVV